MLHTRPPLALLEWTVFVCMKRTFQPLSLISVLLLSPSLQKQLPPLRGGDGLCDMNPPSSRSLTPENKGLSFTLAPASQILAYFIVAGSQTCVWLRKDCKGFTYYAQQDEIYLVSSEEPLRRF